jgi:proteasome assembly chaperone (PAC2) family protein
MKRFDQITFNTPPILLAAWPGMGNVGLIAMDYMRRHLNAQVFAEIDMSPFFIPDSINVKNGIAQFPDMPSSIFHYSNSPDLIIFESNAQIAGRDGIVIIKTILDIAQQYKVQRLFTSAAFAQPMSYETESRVLSACNRESMQEYLNRYEVIAMPDGIIAGLNGLLLGVAASRGIEAACLLGTIPSYAANLSYPKASLEIVKKFQAVLSQKIDLVEIENNVKEMDQHLATIEERIREFFSSVEERDEEMASIEDEKVPHYIMEKIEKLFDKVAKDKSTAPELKKELDRWKLYELYEKRFLDLFKNDDKEE